MIIIENYFIQSLNQKKSFRVYKVNKLGSIKAIFCFWFANHDKCISVQINMI